MLRSFLLTLSLAAFACAQNSTHWVGTWGASPSPQLADEAHMIHAKLIFSDQTIREIVHLSSGGTLIRVRLSNAYGKQAVEIGAAHIALRTDGDSTQPGSDHALTFSGRTSVTIPPDALVLSDPVSLNTPIAADLAVSIYLPKSSWGAGIHYDARQTNYVAQGNAVTATEFPQGATKLDSWVFLTGVDVSAAPRAATLVAFGDSITDGAHSTADTNHRWPNFLATRLAQQHPSIAVLDEGIGGNRILHDPNQNIQFGVSGLARFGRDVLVQPGVKYLIVLEGINDLGHAGPNLFPSEQVNAQDIIAGLKQFIARAHEKNIKIFGATLTPFRGTPFNGYFSEAKEVQRKAINQWIRTSGAFDGVIDFEKAVRDPAHPEQMAKQFDSGDHLHPNDAGYKAMADAIDLALFR